MTDLLTEKYPLGGLLTKGKTKEIYEVRNKQELVIIVSTDDITAGDGARHDIILDKGHLANETTCKVFQLLERHGLPIAFVKQDSATSFIAPLCRMFPFEVVVRHEADGSYCRRYPSIPKGTVFENLKTEIFLKTKGRVWGEHCLSVDDPLMVYNPQIEKVHLYHPAQPMEEQKPFLSIAVSEILDREDYQELQQQMTVIATEAFSVIGEAWHAAGGRLVDYKVEFGTDSKGQLLLADVIDNDSWRVIIDEEHVDKQLYRDGKSLAYVEARYRLVMDLTGRF